LKEHIRAQLAHAQETSPFIPSAYPESSSGSRYPRPMR
jgi:hypothetical protein